MTDSVRTDSPTPETQLVTTSEGHIIEAEVYPAGTPLQLRELATGMVWREVVDYPESLSAIADTKPETVQVVEHFEKNESGTFQHSHTTFNALPADHWCHDEEQARKELADASGVAAEMLSLDALDQAIQKATDDGIIRPARWIDKEEAVQHFPEGETYDWVEVDGVTHSYQAAHELAQGVAWMIAMAASMNSWSPARLGWAPLFFRPKWVASFEKTNPGWHYETQLMLGRGALYFPLGVGALLYEQFKGWSRKAQGGEMEFSEKSLFYRFKPDDGPKGYIKLALPNEVKRKPGNRLILPGGPSLVGLPGGLA